MYAIRSYYAYFGIHTVHYLDLATTTAAASVDMGAVVAGAAKAAVSGGRAARITSYNVCYTKLLRPYRLAVSRRPSYDPA